MFMKNVAKMRCFGLLKRSHIGLKASNSVNLNKVYTLAEICTRNYGLPSVLPGLLQPTLAKVGTEWFLISKSLTLPLAAPKAGEVIG
ncbi:hypothetical protein SFRURICE_017356 [Spodoptera frugiperda]|nr:hypothetical protein SFRURICE_017356 [Spodoptera frugiperda]